MKLFWSPRSPYVRKVMIVAHETGAVDAIDRIPVTIISTQPNDALLAHNPLGQIPTLLTDNGEAVYDSAAICHYLDAVRGDGRLHPTDLVTRLAAERRHALGDGLSALLLAWLSERSRRQPDQSAMRIAAVNKKLPHIFRALEADVAGPHAAAFDIGHVAIAAALGYLDFRFPSDWDWRERYPTLAAWWKTLQARPSIGATVHYDELAAAAARKQDG